MSMLYYRVSTPPIYLLDLTHSFGIAYYVYLKNKFSLNTENLDTARVREILNDKIDEELYNEVLKVLTICDQGKYSPESIDKEDGIIKEMRILLKQIDRNISWDSFLLYS